MMETPTTLSEFEEDLFECVENEILVKMEEEEETPQPKKTRRKRKPKRDVSLDTEGGRDSDDNFDEEEEKKPKKRGRKKKKKETTPEDTDEELTEMQHIFKVVESMMTAPGAPVFLDRPNKELNGMHDYFEVITKPMWLREVERKYLAEEYKNATEIAADFRLTLENCYQYWGPCDVLSKRAQKLEQLFENKIAALPEHVQKLCSLEATHGDIMKEEPDNTSTTKMNNKKGGYSGSKLLSWVINGKNQNDGDLEKSVRSDEFRSNVFTNREQCEAKEKELTLWESEHLLTSNVKEQIASMWEFPVIGQFLHLVYNVLNINPISHLELERMLLIPQASKTLATLITSMLIPPLFRAKLDTGIPMPYALWTTRLHTKVSGWYRSYHSKGDSTVEVFDSLGIEPQFWLVLGENNPLDNHEFHELTFLQRVWLLKGLCDFLLANHKTIQDRINNLETEELREMKLGKDKDGYTYHYFPNFTEVRIYKMAKVPDTKWKNYESGVEEAITKCAEEEDDEDQLQEASLISGGFSRRPLHRPPRSMRPSHTDFKLVCQSLEDVRALINKFNDSDPQLILGEGPNAALVAALQSIITDLEPREAKMKQAEFKIRNKMKKEWFDFQSRDPDYIDPGLVYWERKEKEEKTGIEEEKPPSNLSLDLGVPGTSSDGFIEEGKRERRTRRESSLKMLSKEENGLDDESAEESPLDFDDSEDEWFASKKEKEIKKKKEKKIMSAKKLKKLADISEKMQHSKETDKLNLASTSSIQSSIKVGNVSSSSSEPSVKIKEELPDPDDPLNQFNVTSKNIPPSKSKQDQTQNDSSVPKKQFITVKKEFMEGPQPNAMTTSSQQSVIQTLVPPVSATNVKTEKISKPDLSKVKRSNSPDADVVYISDSEDTSDIKPNLKLLNQRNNVETINYVVPQQQQQQQQPVGSYLVPGTAPNQGQFLPVNVAQPQVYQPTQPITYQMQPTQQIVQQPVIRPNPTIVRLQPSPTRPNISQNQKFVVLQPNANNPNQPNQFVSKGPRAQNNFPTTPTMQNVNWFGGRGTASPRSNATYSPRQRGQGMVVVPNQSPRGRGSPRGSPITPPRGGVQRFTGRTPTTPNSVMRTPTQVNTRTPSPLRGRGSVTPVKQGPVRNLSFNRSPAKPVNSVKTVNDFPPVNDSPDIEGTLVVSMTDSGGFGYAVMLADGGKISLTQDQLAKIRSDNGGTLPKRCKVPLNMQTEGFRID